MPSNPFVTRTETTPPVDIVGVACLADSDSGFLRSQNTGDESWVYGYGPEKKMQRSHWKTPKSPGAKKACQSKSNVKVKLILVISAT
jgi:hypothetical protein